MTTMNDEVRRRMEAMLRAPKPPPLEVARKYLAFHVYDADFEDLKRDVPRSPAIVMDAIEAIEALLATPQEPGVLHALVLNDANRTLADDTDATAAVWLRKLADHLRECLGEYAPPRQA
jgi:hypothetical protein